MTMQLPPWSGTEDRIVTDRFNAALSTREAIRQIQPPLHMIKYMRPRYGYVNAAERVPSIEDVLGSTRSVRNRRVDYTQSQGSFTGTSQPAMSANPF